MNDPRQRWDEQLRAALTEQADSIQAVTPWTPPTDHRRAGRHPWRWLTPLAAATAVVLVVVTAAVTRIAADRDVHPVSPAPPPTVASTPPPTVASTPPPTKPGPTTARSAQTTIVSAPANTAVRPTTAPSALPTITPCMRSHTYEQLSAESSGVYGIQYSARSELASCGGPDDVSWSPTGPFFPLHLSATRILVLGPGGNGDRAMPLANFSAYLARPFTGLFLVAGPSTHPTRLTEIYHP